MTNGALYFADQPDIATNQLTCWSSSKDLSLVSALIPSGHASTSDIQCYHHSPQPYSSETGSELKLSCHPYTGPVRMTQPAHELRRVLQWAVLRKGVTAELPTTRSGCRIESCPR